MTKSYSEASMAARRSNGLLSNQRRHENGFFSHEAQSNRRLAQLETEQRMARELEAEGYEVFSPTVVCDRIAVKDGKVYFVEFKQLGQGLRPGQQTVHDLMPENYLIKFDE